MGLIQGFINLTVDCNRNLSYIAIVSGNRLRRRGRRQWVTATLSALPPSAEAQRNRKARVGLAPSSRLIKLHVGKEKAKLCRGTRPSHIRNTDDPTGTDMGTPVSP